MTTSQDGTVLWCSEPGCNANIAAHAWSKINDGATWFMQKNGDSWCPKHHPDWVEAWRKSRALEYRQSR